MVQEYVAVELLEKFHRLQIFVSAVDIGRPLSVLPSVIQVKHGGHRVHPQAVDVVLPQPVGRGGQQEAAHLGLAEVKHPCAPSGVLPLAGIGVLVAACAVEFIQAERILREMGGHPVQNDAYARLMELVDEPHQVVGRAEPAGGREIAGTLIAPGHIQRVLGDGHQLHMGEAHLLDVGDQVLGDGAVGEKLARSGAPPGAQMDLVDVQRIVVDGVGLGQNPAVGGVDGKFIGVIALQAGHKALPNAAAHG